MCCAVFNPATESVPARHAPVLPSERVGLARRTIYRANEWYDNVPFICEGWAASVMTLSDGRRQILSFLLPGDIVSAAMLFEERPYFSVEAITEVRYRTFKRTELKAMLFARHDIFDRVGKACVEEKFRADHLAVDLGRGSANERIAQLILTLSDRLAKRGMVKEQTLEFPLRQRHIADATGLTPVHVSKVLGEFRQNNLIEITDRTLTIHNPAELRRVGTLH
jgi:CRP-like cAMP-binding protein